jgi:hypothetical protein
MKFCKENGIDPSSGMVDKKLLKRMMNNLSEDEKRHVELISKTVSNESLPKSVVDLERLQDKNPQLYKKMLKYCRDNGIDISSGKIDQKLIKGLMNEMPENE